MTKPWLAIMRAVRGKDVWGSDEIETISNLSLPYGSSRGKDVWGSDEIETYLERIHAVLVHRVEKMCGAQMRLKLTFCIYHLINIIVEKMCGAQMRLKHVSSFTRNINLGACGKDVWGSDEIETPSDQAVHTAIARWKRCVGLR